MRQRHGARLVLAILFCIFASSLFAAVELGITYSVITRYGPIQELTSAAASNESVVASKDGQNAYLVRSVPVQSEAHLLQLMGGNENNLTDLQRGLLETYRFSSHQRFNDLKPRYPSADGGIRIELADITGYEDTGRYPKISDDFWPQNARVYRYENGAYNIHSEIRISGSNCIGYGPGAAEQMKGTYAHEFGHALDLTAIEPDGYGFDNSHYTNEKTAPKASFAEGFAEFIKTLFFPEEENRTRNSLQTVKIEKPEGGYDSYPIAGGQLTGEDYLNVEAINALIFTRLSKELPDGEKLVLDSFSKHNNRENRMAVFLQNFVKDYPGHAFTAAQILDRETFGNLSNAQMRTILGQSSNVDRYLASRGSTTGSDNTQTLTPQNPASPPVVHRPGTIYQWKDANGNTHYTDSPPPAGIEYTIRRGAAASVSGHESGNPPSSDPFNID
jgi:hypothetical protein